jgi:hypothetical protein
MESNSPLLKGWSGIFHFPYRINAEEELCQHEAQNARFRYCVHAPFLVRNQASPVTDDVPTDLWPDFRWHHSVRDVLREPTAPIEARYNTSSGLALWYDGLRIDIWGSQAQEQISPFVTSFMRWLRHLSGQPWISDVDRHSPSILKRVFPIDESAAAVGEVHPFGMLVTARFHFVTDSMWQRAFEFAVSGQEVPVYSNLFFDAVNAGATQDYARGAMNLAMALESCRDQNFSQVHPAKFVVDRGPQLEAPFDHTDLLDHLSNNAEKVFHRDFSKEHPEHWEHLRNLYMVRHHVAHGKAPVFQTDRGLQRVERQSFGSMITATGTALTWIESLSRTPT